MRHLIARLVVPWTLISWWAITVTDVCGPGEGVWPVDIAAVCAKRLLDCSKLDVVSGTYEFIMDLYNREAVIEFSHNILNRLIVPQKIRHFSFSRGAYFKKNFLVAVAGLPDFLVAFWL